MEASLELGNGALILLNLQNDFVHSDGIFAKQGKGAFASAEELAAFIEKTQKMIDHMHAQGRPVIVVKTEFRHDFADCSFGPDWSERVLGQRDGFLVGGTWGAELIDGFTVAEDDLVITTKGHSAFVGNYLDRYLSNMGVEQIVVVGGPRESSLSDTCRHGAALGYDTFIVSDAIFPTSSPYGFNTAQGDPVSSEDFLAMEAFPSAPGLYRKGGSALLVIDMQNHFLYNNLDRKNDNSEPIQANDRGVVNAARAANILRRTGVPVMWVQITRRHDRLDTIIRRAGTIKQFTDAYQILDDTWAQEAPDALMPHPGDILLWKRGNSSFDGTHLHRMLRNLGVEHLYVAGGNIGGCLSSTVRSGSALGYKVTIIGDATYPAETEAAADYKQDVLSNYGPVVTTEEVIAAATPTAKPATTTPVPITELAGARR